MQIIIDVPATTPAAAAYELGAMLTNFYAESVGKPLDHKREFTLLINWREAIQKGLKEAQDCRLTWLTTEMLTMKSQCDTFIQANTEETWIINNWKTTASKPNPNL
jgi:hypothetical protein